MKFTEKYCVQSKSYLVFLFSCIKKHLYSCIYSVYIKFFVNILISEFILLPNISRGVSTNPISVKKTMSLFVFYSFLTV